MKTKMSFKKSPVVMFFTCVVLVFGGRGVLAQNGSISGIFTNTKPDANINTKEWLELNYLNMGNPLPTCLKSELSPYSKNVVYWLINDGRSSFYKEFNWNHGLQLANKVPWNNSTLDYRTLQVISSGVLIVDDNLKGAVGANLYLELNTEHSKNPSTGGSGRLSLKIDPTKIDPIIGLSFDIKYDATLIDSNSININGTGSNISQNSIVETLTNYNGFIHIVLKPKNSNPEIKNKFQVDSSIVIDFRLLPVDNVSGYTLVQVQNPNTHFATSTDPVPDVSSLTKVSGSGYPTGTIGTNSFVGDDVTVYPNPMQSYININLGDKRSDRITISDIEGKIVKVITGNNTGNVKIEVDNLQGEIYIITIHTDNGDIIKKVIKTN